MTVTTWDEALAQLQAALAAWIDGASNAARQAALALGQLHEAAEQTRQDQARRAAAAAEGTALPLAARAAQEAQARHLTSLVGRYYELAVRVAAVRRRLDGPAAGAAAAARGDLNRRRTLLEQYRTGGGGRAPAGPASAPGANGPPGGAASAVLAGALAARAMEEVPLDDISYADNPIVGEFGRGGTTVADYRWAVETWETTVRPGVAAGMGRDDFAQRDAQRSAGPLRRTADVFDLFLGDTDRIRLSPRAGGGYDVTNGRHRIQAARDLGLSLLPASVFR